MSLDPLLSLSALALHATHPLLLPLAAHCTRHKEQTTKRCVMDGECELEGAWHGWRTGGACA